MKNLTRLVQSEIKGNQHKIYFFENYILKNFLIVLQNPSDSVREESLGFLRILLKIQDDQTQLQIETCSLLLKSLTARFGEIPFKENIEELRLMLIKLLGIFLKKNPQVFRRELTMVIKSLTNLMKDKYHHVKKETCSFIQKLAKLNMNEFAIGSKNLIIELSSNGTH